MEAFMIQDNPTVLTVVLFQQFFKINHWVKCYFLIAVPNAKEQIFGDMEQLDRNISVFAEYIL